MSFTERAAEVLRGNDRGDVVIPSSRLYPHQWAWDSAFISIGLIHIDLDRAVREIESLFSGQWSDGRIPHIRFSPGAVDYFPGPDFWRREATSTISNPPMWVIALSRLAAAGADRARLAPLFEAAERSLAFFADQRDPLSTGAVAVVHPWESGRDNCPAWDAPLEDVDPARAPPFERVDLAKVGDPSQRPTDAEYKRYAVLVHDIADDNFGPGSFAVYDPMMTALALWAETELAALRGAPSPRVERLRAGLDALWDDGAGRYGFHDARADRRYSPEVLAGYLPILVEPPGDRRETLLANLEARYGQVPYPYPTAPPDAAHFEGRRYWRGPTWINTNWLLAQVPELSETARRSSLELIEVSGFREYFACDTGEGLGADQFSWTAALGLDLID